MIPGNVDPRRAEKVQRYKPPQANGNAPVEDLTPDYMNILGPDSATANADVIEKTDHEHGGVSSSSSLEAANGTNVIPTSPQYGVAIISGDAAGGEVSTAATDSVVETTAKTHQLAATLGVVAAASVSSAPTPVGVVDDGKDMHSTPSRNDRFKVVKIASLEPFRRGRWKCMDYVDEHPPAAAGQQPSKQTQSATNLQQMGGMQYMQTQSLPQQHFQQMLVQGAFAGTPAAGFYQGVPNQMLQGQYFYPGQTTVISQQVPVPSGANTGMQQFINAAGQQYFPANVPPHAASAGYTTYSNVQYVQPNLIQTQSSAFVPTSQAVVPNSTALPANFQQSQTYAGQPSTTQPPMVNGHAFPPGGGGTEQPQVASLPTQIAKNVILQPTAIVSMNQTPPVGGAQNSITQQAQYNPSYQPTSIPANQSPQATPAPPANITAVTQVTQGTPIITPMVPIALPPSSQMQNQTAASLTAAVAINQMHIAQMNIPTVHSAPASSTNAIYLTAQGGAANSCDTSSNDGQGDGTLGGASGESKNENQESASGEDPAKANPVVNAIDNKIEQAMDLVKSHLMYTVREEVEVLKEKIVELMERIQQLETENAYLKHQVMKGGGGSGTGATSTTNGGAASDGTPDPTLQTPTQQPAGPQ